MRRLAAISIAVILALPAVAAADYRDTVRVLRVGLVEARAHAARPLRLAGLRKAVAGALGIPVEVKGFDTYAELIDAQASGRIDYAVHSALSFAATDLLCGCVAALRRPLSADGSAGFRSVLVLRRDSGDDLARLRVAYSSRDSLSGWKLPMRAVETGSLVRPHLVEAGSTAAAVEAYATGKVEGIFAWVPEGAASAAEDAGPARLFGGIHADRLRSAAPYRVAWTSDPVFNGPHALRRDLPDDLAARMAGFLDDMATKHPEILALMRPGGSAGFVRVGPEDYRGLSSFLAGAGRKAER